MGSVTQITDADFETEVLQASQPVLVYFWASWCGPCRLMSPAIETVSQRYDDLKIVKLEVDPNPDAVARCKVEGVPALRFFQAGELKGESEGALSRDKLIEFLEPHLSSATS